MLILRIHCAEDAGADLVGVSCATSDPALLLMTTAAGLAATGGCGGTPSEDRAATAPSERLTT